jgi:UDPglucose 6-dehydrogenase
VIGSGDDATAQQLTDLYAPYVRQGNPILVMDIPSAEMVKYASNAMLATKISFINEIANLCEAYGADVDEVRRGMCADRRIGNQFLYPGLGYGGSCFPKDVLAVISMGADRDVPTLLMRSVDDVNRRQRASFLRKIVSVFGEDLRGRRFAVWGLAFKPGTDDVREAPAITLVESLAQRGADVVAYDPVARETARELLHDGAARFVDSAMAAVDGADALVVATEWNEFRHPDFVAIKKRMRMPIVFDGRNIFRPATLADLGFVYHSVGRAAVGAR